MNSTVPGPRLPRAAQSLIGILWPIRSRATLRAKHGPVFRTNDLIAGPLVHIADPALVAKMFRWKGDDYSVAEPREPMAPVVGRSSILLLDGARHMRSRRLLLPAFRGEAIAHFEELIADETDREIDGWRTGQRIRMRTAAQRITMQVIIRAVFGITDPERIAELQDLLPRLTSVSLLLTLKPIQRDLGPLSPWGRFIRTRARVDEIIFAEVARRRSHNSEERDILALLLAATDENGEPLSDSELRDQLITLLLAGHETTATSIAWAFERLLRAPVAMRRASDEARAGDGHEYIDAVIKETLRLRPVITEVFRSPTKPVDLGGYHFAAGEQLAAAIMLVQYDPELYQPDPLAFRPERFLDNARRSALSPYIWIPFGGGVRRCAGAIFAELEMRIIISRILARASLAPVRQKSESARLSGVALVPNRGGEALLVDRL
jgi:cytochrome P450